ncbi:MAG TPA: carbohydrate ABC transporter permease [Arsenicitalea sp.]|jgi:multiple sugar transport system permease protein|nr:carbohydrate ABC transporter permease [Arsenicitalea sp.]
MPSGLRGSFHAAALLAVLGIVMFPFYWMLVTALTSPEELFNKVPRMVPNFADLGVFVDVFRTGPIGTWLLNSTIVATGTTALALLLSIFPAYALSRFRFHGKGLLGLSLFATQMLPEAMIVVPLYSIFSQLGLLNSLFGLIVANAAFTIPIITWVLKGAIDAIPIELEEAARIDGCSRLDIVLTVTLPLIAPTLAAGAVLAFFHGWNEYLFALTFTSSDSLRTASVGVAGFVGELVTPIHAVMAIGLMYTLPAVAFYLVIQRYVVAGLTSGGVKG